MDNTGQIKGLNIYFSFWEETKRRYLQYNPRREGLVILIPGLLPCSFERTLGAFSLLAKGSCRPGCLLIAWEKWVLLSPLPRESRVAA